MTARVSQLHVYPVKSCRGIAVGEAELDDRGFVNDRRWMIVDEFGDYITQREVPQLATIDTRLTHSGIQLGEVTIPTDFSDGPRRRVRVWSDVLEAVVHEPASAWLSGVLARRCELVFMPDDQRRQVDPQYARPGEITNFADGFPLLLISEESLADLNARLEKPVEMRRFRPNIVVSGCDAFAEDRWTEMHIGEVLLRAVKPCSRCVITTVDPETGAGGLEPLRTLARYRVGDGGVHFGMNVIHESRGTLRVGDPVTF